MGTTGNSTGIHLHFEIRNITETQGQTAQNSRINPLDFYNIKWDNNFRGGAGTLVPCADDWIGNVQFRSLKGENGFNSNTKFFNSAISNFNKSHSELYKKYAKQYGLDPDLLAAVFEYMAYRRDKAQSDYDDITNDETPSLILINKEFTYEENTAPENYPGSYSTTGEGKNDKLKGLYLLIRSPGYRVQKVTAYNYVTGKEDTVHINKTTYPYYKWDDEINDKSDYKKYYSNKEVMPDNVWNKYVQEYKDIVNKYNLTEAEKKAIIDWRTNKNTNIKDMPIVSNLSSDNIASWRYNGIPTSDNATQQGIVGIRYFTNLTKKVATRIDVGDYAFNEEKYIKYIEENKVKTITTKEAIEIPYYENGVNGPVFQDPSTKMIISYNGEVGAFCYIKKIESNPTAGYTSVSDKIDSITIYKNIKYVTTEKIQALSDITAENQKYSKIEKIDTPIESDETGKFSYKGEQIIEQEIIENFQYSYFQKIYGQYTVRKVNWEMPLQGKISIINNGEEYLNLHSINNMYLDENKKPKFGLSEAEQYIRVTAMMLAQAIAANNNEILLGLQAFNYALYLESGYNQSKLDNVLGDEFAKYRSVQGTGQELRDITKITEAQDNNSIFSKIVNKIKDGKIGTEYNARQVDTSYDTEFAANVLRMYRGVRPFVYNKSVVQKIRTEPNYEPQESDKLYIAKEKEIK